MEKYSKWVACWGNATSIKERTECTYAKEVTLRYPILMCFDGDKIRIHFSNLTGTEKVSITKCRVSVTEDNVTGPSHVVTLNNSECIEIAPKEEIVTDEIDIAVKRGQILKVSMYLGDYTQMDAATAVSGPLSTGDFCYGDYSEADSFPIELTRKTDWLYFLNTVDVHTEEKNHAVIAYGDSITAQSWPDYLTLRLFDENLTNVSIVRRAVSGSRILRQYNCATYAAYGLKGETRFPIEAKVAGADVVIMHHGINDIIHPVGTDVNVFRPWSDMPTAEDMIEGVKNYYISVARQYGLKIYSATLLPFEGWRTYDSNRESIRAKYNEWLRQSPLFDGLVDFDLAVRDERNVVGFREGFDSGDHLHPSEAAYKAMAACVPKEILS